MQRGFILSESIVGDCRRCRGYRVTQELHRGCKVAGVPQSCRGFIQGRKIAGDALVARRLHGRYTGVADQSGRAPGARSPAAPGRTCAALTLQ